jgi:nitrogen fixation NifU-like protein
VTGPTREDAEKIYEAFYELVTSDPREEPVIGDLGKLAVFGGVREFPMRVKCATLCWHTFRSALSGGGVVSTE